MLKNANSKKILVSALLLAVSFGFIASTLDLLKSNRRLIDLKEEVDSYEREKVALEDSINYKKTNEYIEERARDDLNLIKSGETIYVVVGEDYSSKPNVLSATSVKKPKFMDQNWYMWYRLFFDS